MKTFKFPSPLLLFALLVACSTDECSCEGWETRGYPASRIDQTVPSAGQVRLTPSGIDYVDQQIPYLLDQFLPDGLNFCIPRDTSGNPDICVDSTCSNGQPGCQVGLILEDREIRTVPTNRLEIELTISINQRLNFDYSTFIGTVNCYVQVFKDGASESTRADIVGTVPITLGIDGASATKELTIDIGDVDVNLDDVDFKIHGRGNVGDTIACEGASLVRGLFRSTIENQIKGILNDTVGGIADEQTCTRCGGEFGACAAGSCQDGVCRYPSSACVPRPLGVEGRLGLGGLLGDFTAAPAASVDVIAKAGDHAQVNTGVSVGMRLGADPVAINQCIPADPTRRPSNRAVPVSPVINADRTPDDRPFHLGIGIHQSAVEQILWSTWASGVACLDVSTDDVDQLNTSTFALPAPSVRDLITPQSTAQMAIVPQKAPRVVFGENTVTESGGTYEVNQPLIELIWEDLDIHIFGWAQERMLRLFTLRVDFRLPVALVPDGQGNILPVMPPLESGLTNIRVQRTELLTEDPQRIIDLVPLLIGFAGPQLAGAIPDAVAVPEFLGFRLDLDQRDIVGADKNEFLAIFARLERSTQNQTVGVEAFVHGHELDFGTLTPSGLIRPTLVVHAGAIAPGLGTLSSPEFEYQYRVDGGFWSLFERGPEIRINDPLLMAQGRHTVDVRARLKGEVAAVSEAVTLEIDIDIEPPTIAIDTSSAAVKISAEDINPTEVRWRGPDGQWSPWTAKTEIDVQKLPRGPRVVVEVEARDAFGLRSYKEVEVDTSSTPVKSGCAAGGTGLAPLWLMGFAVFFGRRRRLAALVAALFLSTMGCKGEISTNATQRCFGPECQVDQSCEVDSDCAGICPENTGGICEAGSCQCVLACAGGCGDGEFCCLGTGACVEEMPVCEQACDPGYEARVVGTPNRMTCAIDGGGCECVALPPIPIGVHGPYLSMDSNDTLTVLATYNQTYRDLMVGRVNADNTITWHFVDGVPETGGIEGDPEGWRGGTKAAGDAVGTHTAIAIDAAGGLHVVYRDETNETLKYAKGLPVGDAWDWQFEVLEEAGDPRWPSIVVEADTVHVIYSRNGATSELVHRSFAVSAGAVGASETVVDSAELAEPTKDYPARMGAYTSLSRIPSGGVFAVWWNGAARRVGRAEFTTQWSEPEYLAAGSGPYASGRVDAQGAHHIVFQQSSGLRYSKFGDTTETLRVHDGLRDSGEYFTGTIGESARIVLNGAQVVVAFQDAFDRAIWFAEIQGEAFQASKVPLTATEAHGLFTVLSHNGQLAAHFVVDRTKEPWGFVRVESR